MTKWKVRGELRLGDNDKLKTLNGLEGLRSTGSLYLIDCIALENIDALENLSDVSSHLCFYRCLSLNNLDGLKNLRTVGGNLNLIECRSLENVDGLKGIEYISGDLKLRDCAMKNEIIEILKRKVKGGILD
jgi:hypothetical protein